MDLFLGFLAWVQGPGFTRLAIAIECFYWTLPVLIVFTFFVNTWMILDVLYVRILLSDAVVNFLPVWGSRDMLLARVALSVYGFLLLNAAGSISYCWYLANFAAKKYRMPSGSVAPPPRTVMQTTFSTSLRFDFADLGMDGNRPNRCPEECVNAGAWRGDRMYHCRHGYNRCLPVFDHYCYWLWVPVYLNTIKPYCLFMPHMFLYSLYCLVVMVWALISPHMRGLSQFTAVVIFLSSIFAFLAAGGMMRYQWRAVVFRNRVGKERDDTWHWSMAIRNPNGQLVYDEPTANPYSLGSPWANAQEVLGRWYQMPFWFWEPERVGQYGHHLNLDNDTTISPAYMIRVKDIRLRYMDMAENLTYVPDLPPLPPPPAPPSPPPRSFFRRRHNASSMV
ncbi:DHHC zinc finger domain-containing protein [Colletotrichum eremochloae]|nr:DHHC zinc finger domain-containing protein [Colletotrichum eremochloae]